jgi:lysophospholipase L1-like esterase
MFLLNEADIASRSAGVRGHTEQVNWEQVPHNGPPGVAYRQRKLDGPAERAEPRQTVMFGGESASRVVRRLLTANRFVAIGDSMSDGVLGLAPQTVGDPGPPVGYAYKLRTLLASRYTTQNISMTDEGVPGETVSMGAARLPGVLTRDQPDVILLLEGVNDLNNGHDAAIPPVKAGLTDMVRQAHRRGLTVFLATLLPQQPPDMRAKAPESIVPANVEIRNVASAEGAVLVDLYAAFDGQATALIGPDGLHPNETGYQKMADVFFAAIRDRLELNPSNVDLEFGMWNCERYPPLHIPNSRFPIPERGRER